MQVKLFCCYIKLPQVSQCCPSWRGVNGFHLHHLRARKLNKSPFVKSLRLSPDKDKDGGYCFKDVLGLTPHQHFSTSEWSCRSLEQGLI